MNERYVYVDGMVTVITDSGMNEPIPYVDNIGDILHFQNEIAYLESALKSDQELLNKKKSEREYRSKDSMKVAFVIGTASVVGSIVLPLVLGETGRTLGTTLLATGAVFAPTMYAVGLSFRPSKKLINGYEEKINYEKEMLHILYDELQSLKDNPTTLRKDIVKNGTICDINSKYSLKYYEDAINLRFEYGYNPDKFIQWYDEEILGKKLQQEGIADETIMDFMSFVEKRKAKIAKEEDDRKYFKK